MGNYGGPTLTHLLLGGSPAIDKGNSFGLTTDQRGSSRPVDNASVPPSAGGDNADIGAHERSLTTAAAVSISGRVLTAAGGGIGNATVYLTNPDGSSRAVRTNTFGFYRFEDVAAGETYVLTIVSKRFAFNNATRVISVNESLGDVDFVAEEVY